jgi:hypothetical protein
MPDFSNNPIDDAVELPDPDEGTGLIELTFESLDIPDSDDPIALSPVYVKNGCVYFQVLAGHIGRYRSILLGCTESGTPGDYPAIDDWVTLNSWLHFTFSDESSQTNPQHILYGYPPWSPSLNRGIMCEPAATGDKSDLPAAMQDWTITGLTALMDRGIHVDVPPRFEGADVLRSPTSSPPFDLSFILEHPEGGEGAVHIYPYSHIDEDAYYWDTDQYTDPPHYTILSDKYLTDPIILMKDLTPRQSGIAPLIGVLGLSALLLCGSGAEAAAAGRVDRRRKGL